MSSKKLHFKLKWSPTDPSNAIILSFAGENLDSIIAGRLSVVFRKMGPTAFTPDLVYAYVGSPTSAIVAKFQVESWNRQPLEIALRLAKQGHLTKEYLRSYANGQTDLIVITARSFQVAKHPLKLKKLTDDYDFWPSSTFMPLSATGTATIDHLASFTNIPT